MSGTTPSVWEALNEPIVHVTEEQAKNILMAAVIIISAAWITPYWNEAQGMAYYAPTNVFEQMAVADMPQEYGEVAGAQIVAESLVPDWYLVVQQMPSAVVDSFSDGAFQVLDISSPIQEMTEFYQPGIDAVWNTWLNMMRDPGTPEF